MFELQIVRREFAQQLVRLRIDTFKQAYDNVHSSEDIAAYCKANYTLELALADLSSDKTVCCVALKGCDPAGFYFLTHHDCPIWLDSNSSELKQIYILAAAYGAGLGQLLYGHALENIRAADSDWVWLSVSDINYRAQAFYRKLGFEKLGVGPVLQVGNDLLPSSILACKL